MAAPFFSIKVQGVIEKELTTDFEIDEVYFAFMQIFPAYTIETIEENLSWRRVKKLMEIGNEKISTNTRIDRIELMMEKYLNVTFDGGAKDDKTLVNTLRGMGWL